MPAVAVDPIHPLDGRATLAQRMCVPTPAEQAATEAAIALNKLRTAKLTPEQRTASARKAAIARWSRRESEKPESSKD